MYLCNTRTSTVDSEQIHAWILELHNPEKRENALLELSKNHGVVPDIAPMLLRSVGAFDVLIQEITDAHGALPTLTEHQSNRVCNALVLMQQVAVHAETRGSFLQAQVPRLIFPFLLTDPKTELYESLRLISLGVIVALLNTEEEEVIRHLLIADFIPPCLHIMENGSVLSKTLAVFILRDILINDFALNEISLNNEWFSQVTMTLNKMVLSLAENPSTRLLKHIVCCYLRFSDHPVAKQALRQCLPEQLRDPAFTACLQDDIVTKYWLSVLISNLESQPPHASLADPAV